MDWLKEYYMYIILFVVVLVLTVFLFIKSAKAYSSHQKAFKAMESEMKNLAYLKQKYKNFTAESLMECDEEEILQGVGTVYEAHLMKSENGEEEFLRLNENVQNIYVLNILVSDGSLKEFFSQSDTLLKSRVLPALYMIDAGEIAKLITPVVLMYDDKDETVSYDEAEIEKIDNYIEENGILRKIKVCSAEYIKSNAEILKI